MAFKAAKCPECNGDLQIPDDKDYVKCMFCGKGAKLVKYFPRRCMFLPLDQPCFRRQEGQEMSG